jgi:multidrug efflux pump subunit AcrA (membrane-fusion protein)
MVVDQAEGTAKRRRWIVNAVLAAGLAGAIAVAAFAIGDPATATSSDTRTATATTGDVTATVSASGNVTASDSVGVNFEGSGGTVTAIYVEVGDEVHKGQALAKVDDTSAHQALQSAEASLASAQAQYEVTTQGPTAAEQASRRASVDAAVVSLQNARTSLAHAQQTYDLDKQQQDALVETATQAYQQATDPTVKAQALNALNQAKQTRASTLLRDRQQIQDAQGQVAAAEVQLQSARAAAAVGAQPATAGEIAQAQAQVTSAQVQVDQARVTLAQTTLRAPVAGTVTSISGTVGEDSSSAAGSTSSSTTGSSSSSSTTASGFVVIQGITHLQVTSMVAEADAAKVQVGDRATVTFSALDESARGRVTSIDLQDTVSNNVVEYGVTVTLGDVPPKVLLGQTASVSIVTGVARNVLTVPSSAVTSVGNNSTVTVLQDDQRSVRPVQVGLVGDSSTEITSGLQTGDVVVLTTGTDSSGFTFPDGGIPGGFGGGLG